MYFQLFINFTKKLIWVMGDVSKPLYATSAKTLTIFDPNFKHCAASNAGAT
jgi:hypothetical protein